MAQMIHGPYFGIVCLSRWKFPERRIILAAPASLGFTRTADNKQRKPISLRTIKPKIAWGFGDNLNIPYVHTVENNGPVSKMRRDITYSSSSLW